MAQCPPETSDASSSSSSVKKTLRFSPFSPAHLNSCFFFFFFFFFGFPSQWSCLFCFCCLESSLVCMSRFFPFCLFLFLSFPFCQEKNSILLQFPFASMKFDSRSGRIQLILTHNTHLRDSLSKSRVCPSTPWLKMRFVNLEGTTFSTRSKVHRFFLPCICFFRPLGGYFWLSFLRVFSFFI